MSGGTTQTYNYGSTSNQLTSISVSGSTTRSFTYANSGQLSQDARGGSTTYTFVYNNDGRTASALLNGSTVGTYLYNGLEQRVAKTASGTTTHDVYDRFGHLMSEDNGSGAPVREYIWLGSLPIALIDDTGMNPVVYYIHTDQVGRPQKMTDGSASVVWDAIYDPFGNVSSISGSATNLLMFPGQVYDSETAIAQNWNRDYDPTLGRYIESDPMGLAAGINTYGYAGQNPILNVDPSGLQCYNTQSNPPCWGWYSKDFVDCQIDPHASSCIDYSQCTKYDRVSGNYYCPDPGTSSSGSSGATPPVSTGGTSKNQQMCSAPNSWAGRTANFLEGSAGVLAIGGLAAGGAALVVGGGTVIAGGVTVGGLATALGESATAAVGGAFVLNVSDKRFGNAAVDAFSLGLGGAAKIASKALPEGIRLTQAAYNDVMGRMANSMCTGR